MRVDETETEMAASTVAPKAVLKAAEKMEVLYKFKLSIIFE